MRRFYLFFVMMAFTGFTMAQTIENFESLKMTPFDVGANGSVTVVPNPDTTGINKSVNVGKMERGMDGQPWAGWWAILPTPVDVSANKYVHVKVWKTRISPVVFKYEKGVGNNSGDVFSMEPQTKTEEWEELVFDMSVVSGDYSQIVLIPDFETPLTLTEDITLYFDDIYINNDPEVDSEPVRVLEDYEHIQLNTMLNGEEDLSTLTIEQNPDSTELNPSLYVIKFLRDKDGFPWNGFYSDPPTPIDVTTNKFIHVKVWKSRISPIKFKLEQGAGDNVEVASMNPQTKTNEWEDIVFDFTAQTGTYARFAFFPDFEDPLTLTEDITIYIDDIIQNNDPTPLGPTQQVFNVDMKGSGITEGAKVWISGGFGGPYGNWAEPGTIPGNEMLDADGDSIYSITLQLADGVVPFKFAWGTGWTNDEAADRIYNVAGNANLNFVWDVLGYTGVRKLSGASFKLFPNPVTNSLTIQSPDMKGLVVSDLLGRTLKNYKFSAVNSKVVDMSDLQSGLYLITVETSDGIYTSKILKK